MVLARGFCYAHTFLHSICSYTLLWRHGYFSVWRNSVLGRSAEGGQQKRYQASEYHGMDGLIRALCRLRHASVMRSTLHRCAEIFRYEGICYITEQVFDLCG